MSKIEVLHDMPDGVVWNRWVITCPKCDKDIVHSSLKAVVLEPPHFKAVHFGAIFECPHCFTKSWVHRNLFGISNIIEDYNLQISEENRKLLRDEHLKKEKDHNEWFKRVHPETAKERGLK